jgi:twitching motility protein PilT
MQVGQQKFGMQTMSQALLDLHQRRLITTEEALGHATELEELRTMMGHGGAAAADGKVRPLSRY